ncbi:MAG: HD domain-containing protein [Candidatus Eisenbacteria sp.]|nr:HD domain-containing protein [Candidatus Eisenbacteria bacterium]
MSTLERAIQIAARAHASQQDKAGQPYILHPLRVMLRLDSEEERIVAVLHDLIEDTEWTSDDLLSEGFSPRIVDAVLALTRQDGESYDGFVRRAARNPIGRRVKIADLEDNMDLSRIPNPTARDQERLKKYERAYRQLAG